MTLVRPYDPWNDPLYIQWQEKLRAAEIEKARRYYSSTVADWAGASYEAQRYGGYLHSRVEQSHTTLLRTESRPLTPPANAFGALWAPLQADRMQPANRDGLAFAVKAGGAVTISSDTVTLYGAARHDQKTVETAVLQAVTTHGRNSSVKLSGGTETSRAQYWAYAQMHGLRVRGYRPTKAARELVATLTSHRTGTSPQRPDMTPPLYSHDYRLAAHAGPLPPP